MISILLFPFLIINSLVGLTGYEISSPSKNYNMPAELLEISGIVMGGTDEILCIQDEKGVIYNYGLASEKISNTINFAGKGDFEDLAIVNEDIYVLNSTGSLYKIKKGSNEAAIINISIEGEKDAEALCYDKKNNRLLFAFKRSSDKEKKNIYAFDLGSGKVSSAPAISIPFSEIFKEKEKKKKRKKQRGQLAPSAIAIHPNGTLFLVSSENSLLLNTDLSGNVIKKTELPQNLFPQPEGITFAENGDMFISNEGRKNPGTILKFVYAQ